MLLEVYQDEGNVVAAVVIRAALVCYLLGNIDEFAASVGGWVSRGWVRIDACITGSLLMLRMLHSTKLAGVDQWGVAM